MRIKNITLFLFFFLFFFFVDARPLRRGDDDCVYTMLIKKEDLFTRGKTVMKLQNADGETTEIKDLKPWAGHMGLDILNGRGKCLDGPVSTMSLNSNAWGLNSVELDVTSSRVHIRSTNELFAVEQWEDRDSTSFPKQLHDGMNQCSCLIFMANAADNMSSLRAISGGQTVFAMWNQRSLFHCSSSGMNKMKLEKPFVKKAQDEERLLMRELLGSIQCYKEKQALGEVSPKLLETKVNPAVWEISGHMVLKRKKDYEEASEKNVQENPLLQKLYC